MMQDRGYEKISKKLNGSVMLHKEDKPGKKSGNLIYSEIIKPGIYAILKSKAENCIVKRNIHKIPNK